MQTTLGDLITALSEETRPFLRNERETSIVVGYIFNDLIKHQVPGAVGKEHHVIIAKKREAMGRMGTGPSQIAKQRNAYETKR